MRESLAALVLLLGSTVAFVPSMPSNSLVILNNQNYIQKRRDTSLHGWPVFPNPLVTSKTPISSELTKIMESRRCLLEIETATEKARESLSYLTDVADVIRNYLNDQSTPLRANLNLPELQNIHEATEYLVNIEKAKASALAYLQYLQDMARTLQTDLLTMEQQFAAEQQASNNVQQTQEMQTFLDEFEETAVAAKDYLKYLQTVAGVVQHHLVDPNLKGIHEFMPQKKSIPRTRRRPKLKVVPPRAPALEVYTMSGPRPVRRITPLMETVFKSMDVAEKSVTTASGNAYLESLRSSSTTRTTVSGDTMDYLDSIASNPKVYGVSKSGGTIQGYLDSIAPSMETKLSARSESKSGYLDGINTPSSSRQPGNKPTSLYMESRDRRPFWEPSENGERDVRHMDNMDAMDRRGAVRPGSYLDQMLSSRAASSKSVAPKKVAPPTSCYLDRMTPPVRSLPPSMSTTRRSVPDSGSYLDRLSSSASSGYSPPRMGAPYEAETPNRSARRRETTKKESPWRNLGHWQFRASRSEKTRSSVQPRQSARGESGYQDSIDYPAFPIPPSYFKESADRRPSWERAAGRWRNDVSYMDNTAPAPGSYLDQMSSSTSSAYKSVKRSPSWEERAPERRRTDESYMDNNVPARDSFLDQIASSTSSSYKPNERKHSWLERAPGRRRSDDTYTDNNVRARNSYFDQMSSSTSSAYEPVNRRPSWEERAPRRRQSDDRYMDNNVPAPGPYLDQMLSSTASAYGAPRPYSPTRMRSKGKPKARTQFSNRKKDSLWSKIARWQYRAIRSKKTNQNMSSRQTSQPFDWSKTMDTQRSAPGSEMSSYRNQLPSISERTVDLSSDDRMWPTPTPEIQTSQRVDWSIDRRVWSEQWSKPKLPQSRELEDWYSADRTLSTATPEMTQTSQPTVDWSSDGRTWPTPTREAPQTRQREVGSSDDRAWSSPAPKVVPQTSQPKPAADWSSDGRTWSTSTPEGPKKRQRKDRSNAGRTRSTSAPEMPQTSQSSLGWSSATGTWSSSTPGTGSYLQTPPSATRPEGRRAPKYFFLEEPVEEFFFAKLDPPRDATEGEPISPHPPILGDKYVDQLEHATSKFSLVMDEERESQKTFSMEAAEMLNGRLAMFFLSIGLSIELLTGATLPAQVGNIYQVYLDGVEQLMGVAHPKHQLTQSRDVTKVQKAMQATVSPPPPALDKQVEQSVEAKEDSKTPPPVVEKVEQAVEAKQSSSAPQSLEAERSSTPAPVVEKVEQALETRQRSSTPPTVVEQAAEAPQSSTTEKAKVVERPVPDLQDWTF